MLKKFFLCILPAVLVLLTTFGSYAQTDSLLLFRDDFESYTTGMRLACMDTMHGNTHWDTWSHLPCDPSEDPVVTNTTAYSGTRSVWIQQNNDLIKPIPTYTAGKYSIMFRMYIPTAFTASWGQLATNVSPMEWGFYARFNPSGNGTINAGGWDAAQFTFPYDTWTQNKLIVDLNADSAEYYFDGARIHGWRWTRGSDGDTIPLQLSITDIWGGVYPNTGPTQYYVDDFVLQRLDTITGVKELSLPTEFALEQNYPNPFNPSTTIRFALPHASDVILTVFNTLGQQVAELVKERKEAGYHEVQFDGGALPSGVYFYRLQAGSFVETKKLVLTK